MITNHDDFEVLCAVAASGHLTRGERAELAEHVRHCVSCEKRLIEMRQLAIHLLLAQRFEAPGKHVQKGMQERFAERAIREGIPLSPRSPGVGFGSLSMVSALLVVLLLVTATLKDGTFRRPVLETEVANTAANTADGVAIVNHRESSASAGRGSERSVAGERTNQPGCQSSISSGSRSSIRGRSRGCRGAGGFARPPIHVHTLFAKYRQACVSLIDNHQAA